MWEDAIGHPGSAGTGGLRRSVAHVAEKLADIERQVQAVRLSLASLLQSLGEAEPPTVPAAEPSPLEQWLAERGLPIKRHLPSAASDPPLDRLARFLGERFEHLEPFYDALKQQVTGHESISLVDLRHASQTQLSDIVQFGHQLHSYGVLSNFRYLRGERRILFTVQKHGPLKNFITGGWLERYTLRQAAAALQRRLQGKVWTLNNIVVTSPDGTEIELDILVGSRESVWWIECTTSPDYSNEFKRYQHIRENFLKLPEKRCLLVVTKEITEKDVAKAAGSAGMTLLRVTHLRAHLLAGLPGCPKTPAASAADEAGGLGSAEPSPLASRVQPDPAGDDPDPDVSRYRSALQDAGLPPVEEHLRLKIIRDLCRLASESDGRTSIEALTGRLKESYEVIGEPISKSVISDVRNALRRAGMCQPTGLRESGFIEWRLRDDKSYQAMDNAVAQVYLWTLLKDPALQASDPLKWHAVGRVIYGARLNRWEAHSRIAALITEMEQAGRLIRQKTDDGEVLHTVGEQFWNPDRTESAPRTQEQWAEDADGTHK